MKLRIMDKTFVYLTGLAVLIILALLFTILGNIVANGWTRISWEFLSVLWPRRLRLRFPKFLR